MAKKWLKIAAAATALVMSSSMAIGMAACNQEREPKPEPKARTGWKDEKVYTYNDYVGTMPSIWNDLAQHDGANTDLVGYINSSFFEYDFKFDGEGKVINDGSFEVEYSAATKLEDVSAKYVGQYGLTKVQNPLKVELDYGILKDGDTLPEGCTAYDVVQDSTTYHLYYRNADVPEGKTVAFDEGGFAYYLKDAPAGATVLGTGEYSYYETDPTHHAFAITLRNDLKWDDGTPIHAEDFVYSMSQQLSPNYLFENASNYYSGNYIIHNAKNYLYQGQKGWFPASTAYALSEYSPALDSELIFSLGNASENKDKYGGAISYFRNWFDGQFGSEHSSEVAANNIGKIFGINVTKEQVMALEGKTLAAIKADSALNATWEAILAKWKTDPGEELHFFVTNYTFPEMNFEDVGYFVGDNENELVIVIDNTLPLLDENDNLTYYAAYYFGSWPLVKKDMWQSLENKTTKPWTNDYCTGSVANSASWGPYKLTNYQAGTTYTVERNTNWYGYNMSKYDDQYQTDKVVVRYIPEWQTAWQAFQLGEVDAIGMDVSIANDYKNTKRAYFTPTTRGYSLHLQSTETALTKAKGNAMLKYKEFRQALSLALDRDDYATTQTTSSLPLLGYLNSMYYYDVANGPTLDDAGVYRNTVQAKEALLKTYGATKGEDGKWTVGGVKYDDVNEAVSALTGYNLTLARQLVQSAYDKALAAGDIDEGGKITLTYGVTEQTAIAERTRNYLETAFKQALVGTPLQDKLEVKFFIMGEDTWSDQFIKTAEYDICFGAWMNAPFNPYYMIGAYILDENRFALGWDASKEMVEISFEDPNGETETHTFDCVTWYNALNGSDSSYNFSEYPVDSRLTILAALESTILETYWSIPIYAGYSAALLSYKVEYVTYEYNTFMGYGGMQYMSYNFDDTEWAEFLKEYGNHPSYKF